MLDFLQNILVTILTSYLAMTNSLADKLMDFVPDKIEATESFAFSQDKSIITSIPDILVKNASFQQAAVIGSSPAFLPTTDIRSALVNIFCTYTTDEYQRQTTGSGFVVSPDGVILTNAHVAQFLLLEAAQLPGEAACAVRTGEPAAVAYEAELLYISPAWIQANSSQIIAAEPRGTGERDYALLFIARSLTSSPLPASFPYLATETELVRRSDTGSSVSIAGYPADLSSGDLEVKQSVAETTIKDIYTFGSNRGDIFLLGGTAIGKQGISGGPVINANNKVTGLISTKGNDALQGNGSLNAITLSYVERTMQEETGFNFNANISGDLPYRSYIFTQTLVPFLSELVAKNF